MFVGIHLQDGAGFTVERSLSSKRVSSYISLKTMKVHEEIGSKYFTTLPMAQAWQSIGSNTTYIQYTPLWHCLCTLAKFGKRLNKFN